MSIKGAFSGNDIRSKFRKSITNTILAYGSCFGEKYE